MMKTTVKRTKSDRIDNITVTMRGMTPGKLIALKAALTAYGESSAVGYDVFCSLRDALHGFSF